MKRHSARYVDMDESASLPETVSWLQQSNFLNSSQQSGNYEGNHAEALERTSQVIMAQDQIFPPATILLPYTDQSCSFERDFGEKLMDADEEERRILLAITVEVEDGHLEYIEVRDGDSAEAAATKFCQIHLLPEKYVAPLTEHIVEEVRRISKVDKSIRFASQDGMVYTDEAASNQTLDDRSVQNGEKQWVPREDVDCGFELDEEQKYAKKNSNRGNNERKTSNRLSESLLSPTFTSLAKSQTSQQVDDPKESRRAKQLSERAKAVYMRLYGEFLRQKQRIEEEKRWCQEQFKQRIERDKPAFSKMWQHGYATHAPGTV